jgi:N-methylhydantoinase A
MVDKPDRSSAVRATDPPTALTTRSVYFAEHGGHIDVPVYRRDTLLPGHRIEGPAIIEEPMTSIVVPPHRGAEIDGWRNVRIG